MLHVVSTALLLALASCYAAADGDESSECPNWYHRPPGSHHCLCGPSLQGGTMCSDNEVHLHVDYTMTWNIQPQTRQLLLSATTVMSTIPLLPTESTH